MRKSPKPLKAKAYGSIPHMRGSLAGPGDHFIDDGMTKILTEKNRGRRIVVQEKLDGCNVAVIRLNGQFIPLMRKGYPAISSPHVNHHLWHWWAMDNVDRFARVLREGERLCGEWLAQAVGTKYDLSHCDPFAAFDLFHGGTKRRLTYRKFLDRIDMEFDVPHCLHSMEASFSVSDAMKCHEDFRIPGEGIEGVVYRAERNDEVEFLAKYVRPDKVPGKYMFGDGSGEDVQEIWNWRPTNSNCISGLQ